MKKYKLYFDRSDTPYEATFQNKKRYQTTWKHFAYTTGFLKHIPVKVKLFGLFTIFDKDNPNKNLMMKVKFSELKPKTKRECNCGEKAQWKVKIKDYDGKGTAYICEECVDKMMKEIVEEHEEKKSKDSVPTDKEILEIFMNKKVDWLKLDDSINNMKLDEPFYYNKDMDIAYQLSQEEYSKVMKYLEGNKQV